MADRSLRSSALIFSLVVALLGFATSGWCHYEGAEPGTVPAEVSETTAQCMTGGEATHCVPIGQSIDLDLSSQVRSIHIGEDILPGSGAASITLAGQQRTVSAGDHLTPAEYVALQQVLVGQHQNLLLDDVGRAVGGHFFTQSLPASQFSNLIVPVGVVALGQAMQSALTISGALKTEGILAGFTQSAEQTFTIQAGSVTVSPGGEITTVLDETLASLAAVQQLFPLDLSLNSSSFIMNSGDISASGVLRLSAQASISNSLPLGYSTGNGLPAMYGALGTTLFSGTGTISNSGLIAAGSGSVTFNAPYTHDLVVNNVLGIIDAASINFREPLYTGPQLTQLLGGVLQGAPVFSGDLLGDGGGGTELLEFTAPPPSITFHGGTGRVAISADAIQGALAITAKSAEVQSAAGEIAISDIHVLGNLKVTADDGEIRLVAGSSVLAGGAVEMESTVSAITLEGGNQLLSGGDTILLAAEDVNIGPGSSLFAGTDLVAFSALGSLYDVGPNQYRSATGSIVLAASQEVSVGQSTELHSGEDLILYSFESQVATEGGNVLRSRGSLGIIGEDGVYLGPSSEIVAGGLSQTVPDTGVLSFSHINSPGFVLIGSGSDALIGASITANGGDLAVITGGSIGLLPSTGLSANGGYISLFARGQISGENNSFSSRAAGSPEAFTGGLIEVSSGFTFNPDILSFGPDTLGINQELKGLHSDILESATHLKNVLTSRNPGFVAPQVDENNVVVDSGIMGENVRILSGGADLGLVRVNKIGGGTVDVSHSTVSVSRGSAIFDAVGASAYVSLPGSVFQVDSFGLVPTGLFQDLLAAVKPFTQKIEEFTQSPQGVILATDQNLGVLKVTALTGISGGSGGGPAGGKPPAIKNASLLASDGGSEEPASYESPAEIVIDTGDLGSSAKLARAFYDPTLVIQRTRERRDSVKLAELIRVDERRSNLVLFTTAGQVFSGTIGGSSAATVIGYQGATMSHDGKSSALHSGRLLTYSGNEVMEVATALGSVTLSPHAVAFLDAKAGRQLRVMALGGNGAGAISVQTRGGSALALKPGEEVLLGAQDCDEADVAGLDGIHRSVIPPRLQIDGQHMVKSAFAVEEFIQSNLSDNRSLRLGGVHRTDWRPVSASAATSANASKQANLDLAQLIPRQGQDPVFLLASHGSLLSQPRLGVINLRSGSIFLKAPDFTIIETAAGKVYVRKGALVAVDGGQGKLRVKALSGPGTVWVKAGSQRIHVRPGQEIMIANYKPSKQEALGRDGVGRRQLTAYALDNKLTAVINDFSMTSLVNSAPHLKELRQPSCEMGRRLRAELLKLAAAVELSTGNRGRYYIQPKQTAQVPEWPFKLWLADATPALR